MESAAPFFHLYWGVVIVLLGFITVEVRRLRKNSERK